MITGRSTGRPVAVWRAYHPAVSATDVPVDANAGPAGGTRIGRGLGALTPTGRAAVPLGWALYDFANTIYSYAIVSYAIGLWAVDRLGPADGQFWVLFAGAASGLVNALVSPVLGAMSDRTAAGSATCWSSRRSRSSAAQRSA